MAKHLGFEVVERARKWAKARVTLRKVLDSKSAKPEAIEKAKLAFAKASDELELIVVQVEKLMARGVLKKKSSKPIDWAALANAAVVAAQAVEKVVTPSAKPGLQDVIDVDFEVVEKR